MITGFSANDTSPLVLQSDALPDLQEQLFHVCNSQLRAARQMRFQGPAGKGCDLVLLERILRFEKRLHVPNEGFGHLGRNVQFLGNMAET